MRTTAAALTLALFVTLPPGPVEAAPPKTDGLTPPAAHVLPSSRRQPVAQRQGWLRSVEGRAGVGGPGEERAVHNDLAALDRQYAVNVTGVIATIRAAAKVMGD